jgi:hypothetical protein
VRRDVMKTDNPRLSEAGWLRHQGFPDSEQTGRLKVPTNISGATAPSAPSKDASRLFLVVAATPPRKGGGTICARVSFPHGLRTHRLSIFCGT